MSLPNKVYGVMVFYSRLSCYIVKEFMVALVKDSLLVCACPRDVYISSITHLIYQYNFSLTELSIA